MIFLNMVVMGVEHYGQPPVFTFILELCNALFTTMFALGTSYRLIVCFVLFVFGLSGM
jgi:hypothetical protein